MAHNLLNFTGKQDGQDDELKVGVGAQGGKFELLPDQN